MIKLMFMLVLLSGCTTMTSMKLIQNSEEKCKTVTAVDSKQTFCQNEYLYTMCNFGAYDLKVCGVLNK